MNDKILILRTRKCRKSDVIIRFLNEYNIPHIIKYVEDDKEAQELFKKFNLKASPGIIINNHIVNPYNLIENCRVKAPKQTKDKFLKLLNET